MDADALRSTLVVAASACDDLDQLAEPTEAHDLLHTVDRLLEAGVKLQRHLLHDPGASVDRHGRCHQCGRLLALPLRPRLFWRDGKRGCLFFLPSVVAQARWLTAYAMSIPGFGKALWLWRRKAAS